ncbi:hypothetical protein Rs2_26156 [Raphanus sativus]|nr:hypothetical protein Rs2_26156 [Raphanus sativus]
MDSWILKFQLLLVFDLAMLIQLFVLSFGVYSLRYVGVGEARVRSTLFFYFVNNKSCLRSVIRYLPGFEGPLPFELETGYIGVGEAEEDQLFYYFIKSENDPKTDPLLVWLTGGPGCSSFSGLVYESGPLAFKVETYNGSVPSLVSTTYSWTKVANIIYLDQPVGAGYSYSRNPHADIPSDTGSGYVLGNPVTDFDLDNNTRVPFAHGMALISDELHESMKISCGEKYVNVDPLNTECLKLIDEFKQSVSRIYEELVLDTNCDTTSPDCYTYRYLLSEYWANNESVRRALGVLKGTTEKWERCSFIKCSAIKTLKAAYPTILVTALQAIDLSSSGTQLLLISLCFINIIVSKPSSGISGDHDMTTPFVSTRAWIKSLNYSVTEKWRPWMILDKVAGYTTTYANKMTFATVKGGGHTLEYKPEENSIMFKRWISGLIFVALKGTCEHGIGRRNRSREEIEVFCRSVLLTFRKRNREATIVFSVSSILILIVLRLFSPFIGVLRFLSLPSPFRLGVSRSLRLEPISIYGGSLFDLRRFSLRLEPISIYGGPLFDLRRFSLRLEPISIYGGSLFDQRRFSLTSAAVGFDQRRLRSASVAVAFGFSGGSVRLLRRFGSGSSVVLFGFCDGSIRFLRRFTPVLRRFSIVGYINKVCETLC